MHTNKHARIEPGQIIFPAQYAKYPVPEREWFVKDLIPHKTVIVL